MASWQFGPGGRGVQNRGGNLKVVTTHLRAGYVRKNGAPYSDRTVVTEYFDVNELPNGDRWLTVTTKVDDPVYFTRPYLTSSDFKKLPGAGRLESDALLGTLGFGARESPSSEASRHTRSTVEWLTPSCLASARDVQRLVPGGGVAVAFRIDSTASARRPFGRPRPGRSRNSELGAFRQEARLPHGDGPPPDALAGRHGRHRQALTQRQDDAAPPDCPLLR